MKKNLVRILAVLLVLVVVVAVFVGCDKDKDKKWTVSVDWNYEGAPEATSISIANGQAIVETDIPELPTRNGYRFVGLASDAAGTQMLTFDNAEDVFAITQDVTLYAIWQANLTAIEVAYSGGNIQIGEQPAADKIVVTATYGDGNSKVVTDYTVSTVDSSTAGAKRATVSYTEGGITKSASFQVTVVDSSAGPVGPIVEDAKLNGLSAQYIGGTKYVGDSIAAADFAVTATYSDGTSKSVTDFTFDTIDVSTACTKEVRIRYAEGEESQTATVRVTIVERPAAERVLSAIRVQYNGGDIEVGGSIDKNDLVVTAVYSDGYTVELSRYALELDTSTAAKKTATVSYTELNVSKSATFEVNVVAAQPIKTLQNVSASYIGGTIYETDQLDTTKIVVTALYSDGSTASIEQFAVGTYDFDTAGAKEVEITCTVDGETRTCTLSVTVEERKVSVYFYNEKGWRALHAHCWNDAGYTTTYPGIAMTPVEGKDGWYVVEINALADSIIFNDGGDGQVTATLGDNNYFYKGEWLADYPAEQQPVVHTEASLYLDASQQTAFSGDGAIIKAYIWYTSGDFNAAYPGVEMTKTSDNYYSAIYWSDLTIKGIIFLRMSPDGEEWNKIELKKTTEGEEVAIDFDATKPVFFLTDAQYNGEWRAIGQVVEPAKPISLSAKYEGESIVVGAGLDASKLTVTVSYEGGETKVLGADQYTIGQYDKDTVAKMVQITISYAEGDVTVSDTITIDIIANPEVHTNTIYFFNENGWDAVYAHTWNDAGYTTDWPGLQMTAVAEKEGWFSVEINSDAQKVNFNCGNDSGKTNDLDIGDNKFYYKGEWIADFPAEQVPVVLSSITAECNVRELYVGESIANGDVTVTACYSDGSNHTVENFAINTYDNTVATSIRIKITYSEGDVEKTDFVSVTFKPTTTAKLYLDSTEAPNFEEAGAIIKAHIWYTNGTNNANFPGVIISKNSDGLYEVEYIVEFTMGGIDFVRCNPDDETIWNNIRVRSYNEAGQEIALAFDSDKPVYTLTNSSFDGEWKAYPTVEEPAKLVSIDAAYGAESIYAGDGLDAKLLTVTAYFDKGEPQVLGADEYTIGEYDKDKVAKMVEIVITAKADDTITDTITIDIVEKPVVNNITLYYFNQFGWREVSVYAWDSETEDKNAEFPGVVMTAVQGKSGWYSASIDESFTNVVFANNTNDASVDSNTKTADLDITKDTYFYCKGEWLRDYPADITLYYYNDKQWYGVKGYAWLFGTEISNEPWQGTDMSPVAEHDGWYSITISTVFDRILFNDKTGVENGYPDHQTADLTIDLEKPYWYIDQWYGAFQTPPAPATLDSISAVYNGGDLLVGQTISKDDVVVTAHYSDDSTQVLNSKDFDLNYRGKTATTEAVTVAYQEHLTTFNVTFYNGLTLFYYNQYEWEDVSIYAWIHETDTKNAAFPGVLMNAVEEQPGWYTATIFDIFDHVIFANNDKDASVDNNTQTADLAIEENHYYCKTEWVAKFPGVYTSLNAIYPRDLNVLVGEWLDLTQLTVSAGYSNGDTKVVDPADCEIVFDNTVANPRTQVTVSYTEDDVTISAQFYVAVVAVTYSSLYLDGSTVAENLTDANAIITAYIWYSNGQRNGAYPGVAMTKDNGLYCADYVVEYTIMGVIFARGNPASEGQEWSDDYVWNKFELKGENEEPLGFDAAKPVYQLDSYSREEGIDSFTGAWKAYPAPVEPAVLTSIEAAYESNEVIAGTVLVDEKWTVTAYYSDGTSKEVTGFVVGRYDNVEGKQDVVITYTDAGVEKTTTVTITFVAAPEQHNITVYYFNEFAWSEISVYAWIDEPFSQNADFPGVVMTAAEDQEGWYYAEIDEAFTSVIFANNTVAEAEGHAQTANLTIETNKFYYKGFWMESYPSEVTLYYYNDKGWESVYAYAWTETENKKIKIENNTWHGVEMDKVKDEEGWYVVKVSSYYANVVFNDGNAGKTKDLFIVADNPYCYNEKWFSDFDVLSSISVQYTGGELVVNESISSDMLTVTATYSNGDTATVSNYTLNTYTSARVGEMRIICSYTEAGITKTANFMVTFVEAEVWDGTFTFIISGLDWFENDGYVAYVHVWYTDGTNNGEWIYESNADTTRATRVEANQYTYQVDTTKTLAGIVVVRGNAEGNSFTDQTDDITNFTEDHMIRITSMRQINNQ